MQPKTATKRRGRRNRQAGGVTLTRTFLLGSLPAGNSGFQFSGPITIYPDEATLLPIARSYSEYKFTRFQVTLQPRCATSTQGSKWAGFGYSVPFVPADFAQASALGGFKSSQAYIASPSVNLQPSNSAQRWYPVYQTDLTPAQLADPNIVQAYLYAGTQSVQSGVTAADIHVSYTVQLRGPVATTTAITPAAIPTIQTLSSAQVSSYDDLDGNDEEE